MKILLDTHIFLWFISGDIKLSTDVRDAIRDPDNEVYLSAVSVWEAIVKYQLGKLPLPEHPETYLPKQRDLHQIVSISLDESSVAQLAQLPPLHRDPFDRMLIAVLRKMRYVHSPMSIALCPMPYALCPMPYFADSTSPF